MIFITWLLFVVVVVYSMLDAYQTIMLLSLGAVELNPILNYVISQTGSVYSIYVVKIIILLIVALVLVIKTRREVVKELS